MLHLMKLQLNPFEKIQSGTKTIEFRLNDEKRRLLNIGDQIEFSIVDNPEQKILTQIVGIHKFEIFKELCYSFDPKSYGSKDKEEYELMYKYYSKEDEGKYGVLGVEIIKI